MGLLTIFQWDVHGADYQLQLSRMCPTCVTCSDAIAHSGVQQAVPVTANIMVGMTVHWGGGEGRGKGRGGEGEGRGGGGECACMGSRALQAGCALGGMACTATSHQGVLSCCTLAQ